MRYCSGIKNSDDGYINMRSSLFQGKTMEESQVEAMECMLDNLQLTPASWSYRVS